MVERTATIQNAQGIHCRPSAVIVKAMQGFEGEVRILTDEGDCDPRSIMALLALGLQPGTRVRVEVEGDGEEAVAQQLVELLETHFDFPPRTEGEKPPMLQEWPKLK